MRRIQQPILAITTAFIFGVSAVVSGLLPAQADAANAPSLTISQLKITSSNGQFVTLYNATDSPLDMSKYQLEYFNSYDLSKASSSRLISLAGTVPPHGYFMVNDSSLLLCYQLAIDSLSLGFSSTAGMIEVLASNQATAGGSVVPVLQDYVGWSKTAASGAQTLPSNTNAFLNRQPVNAHYNPVIGTPGAGSWQTVQPDSSNACNLVTASGTSPGSPVPTALSLLATSGEPPATFVDSLDDLSNPSVITGSSTLPSGDVGLMAPKLTELLPNPAGSGNDNTEEFIELYNPNDKAFDLSGFKIQTGTTTLHSYTFPPESGLAAKSFAAYFSADTGLNLGNNGSQVKFLDPAGNSLVSESYGLAKDGLAWALGNGTWYWTSRPTPGSANIIVKSATGQKTASSLSTVSSASKKSTAIKASKTKQVVPKKTKGRKPKATKLAALPAAATTPPRTPIHLRILVLVAGAALLYGAYEYRTDLANRIYQLTSYLKNRSRGRS